MIIGIAPVLLAQLNSGSENSFRHLDSSDGLSSDHTTCIHQDSKGFVWIGTTEGLSRFDGLHFQNYFHNPKDPSHSLSGNLINSINSDGQMLYIATNHGISVFDLTRNEFVNEVITDVRFNFHSQELFNFMKRVNGIWFVGGEKSLFKLKDDFSLDHDISGVLAKMPGGIMRDFLAPTSDDSGNVYFAACGDIAYYNPSSRVITRANDGIDEVQFGKGMLCHTAQPLIQNNRIYFFPWASNPIRYNRFDSSFNAEAIRLKDENPVYNGSVICSAIDKYGSIWFASENGLFCQNYGDQKTAEVKLTNNDKDHFVCLFVYFDLHGNTWVATDQGVYYTADSHSRWSLIPLFQNGELNNVTAQDLVFWDDAIWVTLNSNAGNSIYRVAGKRLQRTTVSGLEKGIRSLYAWDEKHLMVGGWAGEILFDRSTQQSAPVSFILEKYRSLPVVKTLRDTHGQAWFSFGHHNGILRCNLITGETTHFVREGQIANDQRYMPNFSAIDMTEDGFGNIWMVRSNLDGKLVCWDASSDEFKEVNPVNADAASMHFNGESYCIAHREGVIWFAVMREGLFRYDIASNTMEQFTRNDGLISNDIVALEIDQSGVVWMATSQGLAALNYPERRVLQFSKPEGLPDIDFSPASLYDVEKGRMYFACRGYLVSFDPEALLSPVSMPGIYLTGIRVEGQDFGILPRSFTPGENHIDFMFTAVDMYNASGFEYRYRLDGLETQWNENGKSNMASYANVPAGAYVFYVSVKLRGVWSEPMALYSFSIPQHFYRTTWFMVIVLLIFSLLFYAIYWFRIRRIKQLAAIRNRISRDLHDDIGSALSSIRILSGRGRKENDGHDDLLARINKSSQQMLDNMDDIIWAIQPENDKGEQLLIRMREFASEVLEAANIDYDMQFDDRLESRYFDLDEKRNVYLIFKETINNVVKYANATRMKISFMLINGTFAQLLITDNGVGFDTNIPYTGNGLNNIRRRAEELKGGLKIMSVQGVGTTVQLDFELKSS